MAGYIGSKTSVTVVSPETDSRYVNVTGDTMTGSLTATAFIGDGSALTNLPPSGKVLQVVSASSTAYQSIATSTITDVTGLSLSITPSSTSSKIYIMGNLQFTQQIYSNASFTQTRIYVTDGSNNDIIVGSGASGRNAVAAGGHAFYAAADMMTRSFFYLWSPNTTSAQTIKVRASGNASYPTNINNATQVGAGGYYSAISTLTAFEVGA